MATSPSSPAQLCTICLEPPTDKTTPQSCQHAFCLRCIQRWAKTKARCKRKCPVCRRRFSRLRRGDQIIDLQKKKEQPVPTVKVDQILFWPVFQGGCIVNMPLKLQEQQIPLPIINGFLAGIPFGTYCLAQGPIF